MGHLKSCSVCFRVKADVILISFVLSTICIIIFKDPSCDISSLYSHFYFLDSVSLSAGWGLHLEET